MRWFGAACFLVLICAAPARAAEMPTRKAGLWEMTTTTPDGHAVSMQQCVDARTDEAMQSRATSTSQRDCSKRDVQKSGDTMTIDSVCTIAGNTRTSRSVITGSFDSGYTMVITSQGQGNAAGRTITIAAKWAGPCKADQKPGDVIMPNGTKMNILDLARPPGASGSPGTIPTR